jgi:ketosteroid isomerase-like protein
MFRSMPPVTIGFLACALAVTLSAQRGTTQPSGRGATGGAAPNASVEQQVVEASNEWADALYRNDVEAIDRLLAEDYITIQMTPTGGVALIEKVPQLDNLRQTAATRQRAVRPLDRVRVRVYGNEAILTAAAAYKAAGGESTQAIISEVWVNAAGRWRLSHFQPAPAVRLQPAGG